MTIVTKADVGWVGVSKAKQTANLTAQTIDIGLRGQKSLLTAIMPFYDLMSNRDEIGSFREPTNFIKGNLPAPDVPYDWPKATVGDVLWMLSYALNNPSAASQVIQTAYANAGSMMLGTQQDQILHTACIAPGGDYGLLKILLYGIQCNTARIEITRGTGDDSIMKCGMTGQALKYKYNIFREKVKATSQATSLTLDSKAVEGATAALRLDSIQKINAYFKGEERSFEEVTCSAASNATPAVLTIVPPRKLLNIVYKDLAGVKTDYDDGNTTIVWNISDSGYMYIGCSKPVNAFLFTSSVANVEAQTIAVKYSKNDGTFAAVGDLYDGTESGGATLAQTGLIFFNMPTDHERIYLHSGDTGQKLYWYQFSATGALTTTTASSAFVISTYEDCDYVQFYDESGTSYTDETADANSADGSEFGAVDIQGAANTDYVYFCFVNNSANAAYFLIGDTPNALAASMSLEYSDDASDPTSFSAVANLSDGTDNGGKSWAQNGAITWDQISDHAKVTINSIEGKWFRMSWDADLTAGARGEMLRLGNRLLDYEVIFRASESVSFTECTSEPSKSDEDYIVTSGISLYLGAYWNSTTQMMEGGVPWNCRLDHFLWELNHNNGTPEPFIDGTLDRYPKQHQKGNMSQMITIEGRANKADFPLYNEYSDDNPDNIKSDNVREFSLGLSIIVPKAIVSSGGVNIYYGIDLFWPLMAMSNLTLNDRNNQFQFSSQFEVGQRSSTVSSMYYRGINEESTGYGQ